MKNPLRMHVLHQRQTSGFMACDWLAEDYAAQSVYLKGTEQGELKWRDRVLIDEREPPVVP